MYKISYSFIWYEFDMRNVLPHLFFLQYTEEKNRQLQIVFP